MGDFNTAAALLRDIAKRPTQLQQKQVRQDALQPFVAAARANLSAKGSDKTGQLSASLGVAEKPNTKDTSAAGPLKGKRHYSVAVLVEFGTAPHWQPNRNGGTMHPGARAKPFMRPAFEETKQQIVDRAGRGLVRAILGNASF